MFQLIYDFSTKLIKREECYTHKIKASTIQQINGQINPIEIKVRGERFPRN